MAAAESFLAFNPAGAAAASRRRSRGPRNRKKGWKRWSGPEARLGREIGDFLEDVGLQERAAGGLISEQPSEDLFFLDTGTTPKRKKKPPQKPLHVDLVLQPLSKVPPPKKPVPVPVWPPRGRCPRPCPFGRPEAPGAVPAALPAPLAAPAGPGAAAPAAPAGAEPALRETAPKRLGRLRYEEPEPEVQLSEEIAESLRSLRPQGNLLRDRFRSLQRRNVLEPRLRARFKRRYRVKYVEKRSFRAVTL
ncbi:ribosome biogenesis protein NOP53 [Camarhynchus parvulus]|uniref:ribosome biogenesis protein NOP53 n=1 Tax=Geospiza parvula TaxID=87175 RepID=UPI001237F37E|nr:ribosome biogenesis protein NOP53 [Camarhynchus parvulus]